MLLFESLQLACQAFFKPFELDGKLRKASSYLATNVPILGIWSGLGPGERRLVAQAFVAIILGAVTWPITAGLLALWLGYSFWWGTMFAVVGASLLFGVAGLLFVGISFGVSMGGAISLAGSLAAITGIEPILALIETSRISPMLGIIAFGLGSGFLLGLILGLAAIVTFPLRPAAQLCGWVCTIGGGLIFGSLFIWTTKGSTEAVGMGVILAVFFALGALLGHSLGYRRFPVYLVELGWQAGLTAFSFLATKVDDSGRLIQRLYRLSPVRQDELIWFRLWTLDRYLARLALVGDRQFALKAIVEVARSFRQGWAAEAALAAIMVHDLRNYEDIRDIAGAAARLSWFPRAVDLPSLDLQRAITLINEVSQNAEAAIRAADGASRQVNLRKARANLDTLQDTLTKAKSQRVAGLLSPIAQRWKGAIEQALEDVSQSTGPALIENFYIFGNPIPPEQGKVFVGREDLFAKIQENLAATNKPTLVMYGQRRTGKTSVLLQLPNRLSADYVPVFVDLQATAPVDGLNRFLYTLAHTAVRQADEKWRIALPSVDMEDFDERGTHAFYEWLDQTHRRLGGRLLLFTLDEFEKIEEAIEQGRMEVAVLDILRHLIQHYSSWLVLLFAGVHTLEEMGRNWHSYFISVRPLHVSYLDREAARKLILLPESNHSIRYEEQAVEAILEATHAQPFLVQAVCFELIQHLNSQPRRKAGPLGEVTIDDAREAINQAVHSAHPYFSDLWKNASRPEQLILANLAYARSERVRFSDLSRGLDMTRGAIHQVMEQLERRELVERKEGEYGFQVPMVRQWIRDEVSLEAVRVTSQLPSNGARGRGQE